ncbi:Macrolide-specific efflux protein macA precursor [Klebsiella quasipneumoniae]|uniref:efflux RND transporter periplasmic adaptor subunit n=1 Tax=Klebsiella quasipneumoniae TaxID=1463165 RepID=UPI00111B8932|nr:efflux RND transporter periplasmic adaptor subunit [Klebsiella quasipneumoniae]SNQ41553.1 Macrolide-specific efflux protein macA precursor [Klebsiella quasipneumoniae]HBW7922101.1 efflux RND transporter periplasmic adaptor subunit [Klebsiella pneumoniae]
MKLRAAYLLVAIAIFALIIGWRFFPERSQLTQTPLPALTVQPIAATEQLWSKTISTVGSISAWQEVVIGAEIGGRRLTRLLVEAGDHVKRGQLLAQLSPGTLEAELNESRAALQEYEASARDAMRAAVRARALQGSGALSKQAIDQALAASEVAQARVAAARSRLQTNELRLAYTQIYAPDDGVISLRSVTEGTLIQEGTEIMRLQRQGRLEWRAELPGPELALVAPGQAVRIELSSSQILGGRVRRVSPLVDPQNRTGMVYVDLESESNIRAGQFARGEIQLSQERVLTLPETAVLLRDGFSYVFRIDGNKVRLQKVTLGSRRHSLVAIHSGLNVDAAVVAAGVGFLSDGVMVHVAAASNSQPPVIR